MATKTECACCGTKKGDLKQREWGERLEVCAACLKLGREKALARREKRRGEAAGAMVPEPAPAAPEVPKGRRPKAKEPKVTVASAIRDLVDAGRTNAEIWAEIQPRFGLSDDKRWYPAWYRRQYTVKREAAKAAG